MVTPHLYYGRTFVASILNFLILKSIQKMDGFYNLLLNKPLILENGYIIVSDAPGLGVELIGHVARAHPYREHQLHPKMGQ